MTDVQVLIEGHKDAKATSRQGKKWGGGDELIWHSAASTIPLFLAFIYFIIHKNKRVVLTN